MYTKFIHLPLSPLSIPSITTALAETFPPSSKRRDMTDFSGGGGSFRSRDLGYGGSHRPVSGVLNVRLQVSLGLLHHTSRTYKKPETCVLCLQCQASSLHPGFCALQRGQSKNLKHVSCVFNTRLHISHGLLRDIIKTYK